MVKQKFDSRDRARVVAFLEERNQCRLKTAQGLQKYFIDQNNQRYLILGATGDWHGIPERVIAIERAIAKAAPEAASEGILIIARKLKDRIRLYHGPLNEFVAWSERFARSKRGDFQIDTRGSGKTLQLVQVPSYVLDHFDDVKLA